ncbi:IgGFc-binding protein-like [Cetorhinus maximus]
MQAGRYLMIISSIAFVGKESRGLAFHVNPKPAFRIPRDRNQVTVLTACDFNNNAKPFCDWVQDTADDGNWSRISGKNPIGTEPMEDYPNGTGYYIYQEAGDFAKGQFVRLDSPTLAVYGDVCVEFRYYMYGDNFDNVLSVYLKGSSIEQQIWSKKGAQSPSWLHGTVDYSFKAPTNIKVTFEAVRGSAPSSDTAVDNITVRTGRCSNCITHCDFDEFDNLCGWTNEDTPTLVPFDQWNGQTDTDNTGPDDDFSKPGFGYYMLMDSTSTHPGNKSHLRSPWVSSSGCLTLKFHYFMYGTATRMELNVYAAKQGGRLGKPLFSLVGNQHPGWKPAAVNYRGQGKIQFVIEAMRGETPQSDIAVDSVCVEECQQGSTTTTKSPGTSSKPTTTQENIHPDSTPTTKSPGTSSKPTTTQENIHPGSTPTTKSPGTSSKPTTTQENIHPDSTPTTKSPGTSSKPTTTQENIHPDSTPTTKSPGTSSKPTTTQENIHPGSTPTTKSPGTSSKPTTTQENIHPDSTPTTKSPGTSSKPTTTQENIHPDSTPTTKSPGTSSKPTTTQENIHPDSTPTTKSPGTSSKPTTTQENIHPDSCPPHSHFDPCGSGCSPRCDRPRPGCSDTCVAGGCVCDEGFFQTGGRCVPAEQCGCTHGDSYYQPGQIIWSDGCTAVCRCLGNFSVQCANMSCAADEYCGDIGGVNGCFPKGSSTCTASGDPHYTSFDKRKFNFQGNCTYVLAKTCNTSRTPFAVYAANEHRHGNTAVSYVRAVYVSVYGITVSVLRNRVVQVRGDILTLAPTPPNPVNGKPVTVPISPDPRVTIKPSGRHVVVQTDFGLTVRYDGSHHADVRVPSDYGGEMCGLCGDYNGIPGDDFRTPEGRVARDANDFGNSWNVAENCTSTDTEVRPQCTEGEREAYEGTSYCGVLLDQHGPFASCHYKIDPMAFFRDCVYDMCELDGDRRPLCEALEAYVNACQQRNVAIRPWRNDTFCPLACPSNSHYQPCASACPATCLDPRPPPCDLPCAEGCRCDRGFVQSGAQCVSRDQCGCAFNGSNYQPGEVIWSEACNQVCKCLSSNNVQCKDTSCSPDEYCANKGGVQGCYPKGWSSCTASGDPHYTSFDKRKFNFQGNCTYVLAKTCNTSRTPFAVYAANEHRHGNTAVSYVRAVYVSVYGITVSVLRNRAVQVNGKPVTVPISPDPRVTVKPSGRHVVVQTDFGLTVRYDGSHHADVRVPSDYGGEMCGLCGDYNRIPGDDFRTPEGRVARDANDFGNSWNVAENCTSTDTEVRPQCTEGEREAYEGTSYCGVLLDQHGPFASCHYKIDPMAFFRDCVYDMCELDGDRRPLCEALEAYVNACQQRNVAIRPWRNDTFCPLACPANSHYQPCASACPATCLDPRPPTCDLPCAEGCRCDRGFVQSGAQCVSRDQCGCAFNGSNYQPGEVIWSEACNQVCKCLSSNNVQCTDTSCSPDEYCANKGGVQGCYPKGWSSCTASGDPHYTSFDKRKFNFQGNCTYVLAKTCNTSRTPFAVYAANEHRHGNTAVSYVRAVYVSVYGITVSVLKNRVVQVNGKPVTVPISPDPRVTVKPSGRHVVVQTDFGLTVRYDGSHHADVRVPSDYGGEMCGLCGDYNGIPGDDFRTPKGRVARDANDFGNSWNVAENCTSTDTEVRPQCTEGEREAYEGTSYCGVLLDQHGPFASCHYKIDPMAFFRDCVYDMCELDGDRRPLCEALEAYVNACQQRNVAIRPWRNDTFCPLACPSNSHYQPCASACPATCLDPRPPTCDLPCAEGCRCDRGFVQSGAQCVSRDQCGCAFNGSNYQPGEVIWSETCNQVCKCLSNNNVQCKDTSCSPDEYCANKGGVQGCYPKGWSSCTASGDPHYTSFDKRKFNFQGNCTYVLAKTCNTSRTPFAVYAANEHRHGNTAVSYVRAVYVSVYGITVSVLRNRAVQVNGKPVTVPISPDPRVTVKPSGRHVVVQTDFGLTVRYDGSHHADVRVPSDYGGEMCGLCGDYNRIPGDDFRTPEGQVARDANDFGNSWNVAENCTSTDTEVRPQCTEGEREAYEGTSYCGVLLDQHGPFASCHYKIDPMAFFRDCVYDMCELDGDRGPLCEALEAYVNACQQRNVAIRPWRNDTFCPLACPANSHYQPCASACPATCLDPGGVRGCYPKGWSSCTASGDPHYTSFDKRKFNFQGNCTYVLAKTCNTSRTPFAVYAANEHRHGNTAVSYVRAVYVSVYGITVSVLRNRAVQVNGKPVTVPISPDPRVTVKPSGRHVVVQTDFGLTVRYDGSHHADVRVPSDYGGEMCGLCGDYNRIPGDDFRTPEGRVARDANDFGNSWNVAENCTSTDTEVKPQCTEGEREAYEGTSYCGVLLDQHGPFASCHYKIDPMAFFRDCVYDMCELDGDRGPLCEALEAYVNACQQRNVAIRPWRNDTFCPLACPSNSHYQPCASACPATCLDPRPPTCDLPCAEGCRCDRGFVQSGAQCVSRDQCGCAFNGSNYQPGEVIWSEACNQVCKCLSSNNVQCKDTSCSPDEYCANKGGVRGCYPKGWSSCTASGDPHYTSFDKRKFNFQGNCTYVLAKTCNTSQTPFTVYAANEHRHGSTAVSYVRAVYVSVYGITVSVLRNRVVQVDGKTVNTPSEPVRGLSVSLSGKHVTIETDFGLTVRYDGRQHAEVKVQSKKQETTSADHVMDVSKGKFNTGDIPRSYSRHLRA